MKKYEIIKYSEVIQNQDDLWAITKVEKSGIFIKVTEDTTTKDILQELKSDKIIKSADLRKIQISSIDSDIIEIKEKKGLKPICRLERRKCI